MGFLSDIALPKIRLWLDYILIVIAIITCSACWWLFRQNGVLHESTGTLKDQVTGLQGDVKAQAVEMTKQKAAVQTLADLRQRDSDVVQGLLDDYKSLGKTDTTVRTRISQLEKKSDEVKSLLDTRLPTSVQRVLANQPDAPAPSTSK
jgi:hypothetical protein